MNDSDDTAIVLRTCTQCGESKPATLEFFHHQARGLYGLASACKKCRVAGRAEYLRAKSKEYHRKNRERVLAQRRLRRKMHGDVLREQEAQWRKAHPGNLSAIWARRRAAKHNASGSHTAQDIADQYDRQKGKCFWCGKRVGEEYHVDHVVPLAKGGSNGPENLVIACPSCNISKRDKHPMDFAGVLL